MEAMPKNKYEDEKKELPNLIESIKMFFRTIGGSSNEKHSNLDKRVEWLKEEQRKVREEHRNNSPVVPRVQVSKQENRVKSKGASKNKEDKERGE